MTNEAKQRTDYIALAIFFPAVVALALVPIIMRATLVVTDMLEAYRLFGGAVGEDGLYYLPDVNAQAKAYAVVFIAIVMLGVALLCCGFMFKNAEKRTLVYTGSSVVFVLMSLMSALGSEYQQIAFYGVADRAEGFFTTACYFVLFLFTMYAFRKTQNFKYIIIALMICTGVNFIIGMFQFTGNNLFGFEWFRNFATDGKYGNMLELNTDGASYGSMYGALYHYNYVGSFTGMVIPLFAVLAINGKNWLHKLGFAFFAAISAFMLLASSARSGIVAVAAAAVVGLVVFGRVLVRRWKITVSVIAAIAVVVVGANFALDNALFKRIPSLFTDVVEFIAPAEEVDILDTLPTREIIHNDNGTVSFATKDDMLTLRLTDSNFTFTDKKGEIVFVKEGKYENSYLIDDARFQGLNFEFVSDSESENGTDYKGVFVWFNEDDNNVLMFYLFNDIQLHMVDVNIGDRLYPENAEAIGFEGKELMGSSRGYIWSRTLPLLDECLFTGYGPDTFAFEFPQNDYLAKYYSYNEGFYITVDKSHNLYLQIFFSNGLIALIAFAVIVLFYLVDSFRLYALKREYRREQIYGISVMLAIIGYLVAGIFNDSVVAVAPVFWILLGTGAALNTINRRLDKGEVVDVDLRVVKKKKSAAEIRKEEKAKQDADVLATAIRVKQQEERNAAIAAKKAANQANYTDDKRQAVLKAMETAENWKKSSQENAEALKNEESAVVEEQSGEAGCDSDKTE